MTARPYRHNNILEGRVPARRGHAGVRPSITLLRQALLVLVSWMLAGMTAAPADIAGSFIQLHRGKVDRPTDEWRADMRHLKALGGDTVIVQWTAEEPVVYFEPVERLRGMSESYPVLGRIFDAAEAEGVSVVLGLQHHPEYWDQIKGREKVIRDFFRIRMARNERLQGELLRAFGDRAAWTGYYIPDEIDDFTWRAPEMRALIRTYVHEMSAILRANDPGRTVSVSAFFRGRTMPELMIDNLLSIVDGSNLDVLMIQDGVGVGDPPLDFLSFYYESFAHAWAQAQSDDTQKLPALWCVVETFEQISGPAEEFSARPASAERLQGQVQQARKHFDRLILFTFDDYIHPERGDAAKDAYEALRSMQME